MMRRLSMPGPSAPCGAREHGRALCMRCGRASPGAVALQGLPCVPAGKMPPGANSALRAGLNNRALLASPGWARVSAALLAW